MNNWIKNNEYWRSWKLQSEAKILECRTFNSIVSWSNKQKYKTVENICLEEKKLVYKNRVEKLLYNCGFQ